MSSVNYKHSSGGGSCLRDYGRICTFCGTASLALAGIYLLASLLMRYYLDANSLQWFETMPTYTPAITYSVCGLLTLCCAFKAYRVFVLLKLSAYLALANATLSSVLTLAVVFVNLKVLNAMDRETCEPFGTKNNCKCNVQPFSPAFPKEQWIVFDNVGEGECNFGVSILSFCLLILVPTSISGVFLSIFMWRLLDELIE